MADEIKTETPTAQASITETGSMLERAEKAAERSEAVAKRIEEATARQEAIAARILLSGRAEAGQVSKAPEDVRKAEIDKQIAERSKGM